MRFSLIRSFVVALGCLGIVCQSAHANTATPLSHQNVANQKIHKPKAAAKNAQHANAAQKKQQKQAAKVAQNKQAKQQKAAAVVVPGNDIKAAKQAVEQAKKNVQAAKATHKQPAIKKAQNALKQAQQVLQAAQAQKKAKAQKQLETPVVVAASAAPVVATVGTPVPVVTTASVTPAVTVTTAAAPSTQDVKMLENLVAGSVSKAVAQQKDSVWPQRVQKAEQIATQAAAAVTQAASSVGAQLAAVVTSATISNTAKSMADIPAGTIVGLYSVRDNQFVQIDGDKFLKPGVTEADVSNQPKAQFKMVNDGTNVGFERTETNGNRLQCEPGSKIARFENANFGDWEKMVAEFDGDTVYLKSLITNNYLGSNDAANKQLYAMNPKGDATKFKIKIIKAAPAAAPVTAAAASATISNTAKSMADIPAGTIVGLYSVRDNQFVQIDGDKFLKPGVTEADVANQPKAQFKMVNDGTNVGFERTETNGNRLQCEPGSKIARFENANFGDWEKMVAEFDGDTVYLKSLITNNYLGSNDAANKQLYAMNPKGDATKFKIKIIKAAPAAAPVTAAAASATISNTAKSMADIPAGTIVGLYSVRDNQFVQIDGDKFLKPGVTEADVANQPKAQFKMVNDGTNVGFERTETNGNRLQCEPGSKIARFENANFGDWEKMVAEFDGDTVYLKSVVTNNYLGSNDAANKQLYAMNPKGDATKFKIKIIKAASAAAPVTAAPAAASAITASYAWYGLESGTKKDTAQNGKSVAQVINESFIKNGNRFETDGNFNALLGDPVPGQKKVLAIAMRGPQGLNVHLRFIEGVAATWTWGSTNLANPANGVSGVLSDASNNQYFQAFPSGTALANAATSLSPVWGVNAGNEIYMRTGITAQSLAGSDWWRCDGSLMNISASGQYVWGVNRANQIFFRTGVTGDNPRGTGWQQIDGALINVSVNNQGTLWGVNAANEIFMRTGTSAGNPTGSGWQKIDGALMNVSVTNAGILYGVNRNNDIFVRTGISATNPVGSGWQQIDGKLINISANEKVLWGVNGNNDIFMRTGVSPYKLAGDGWKQVDGKLMNISVDANGVVWGVNSANDIFMRTGISDANPAGTGWLNVPGKLINITN